MKTIIIFNFLMCTFVIYGAENTGLKDKTKKVPTAPKIVVTPAPSNSCGTPIPQKYSGKKPQGSNLLPGMPVTSMYMNRSQNQSAKIQPGIERVKSQPTIVSSVGKTPHPNSKDNKEITF